MLNSKQIEYELKNSGFEQVVDNARINGFKHYSSNLLVYTKTASLDSVAVNKEPLIIHPRFQKDRARLDQISGISPNWLKYIHNSNLKGFDKRINKGKNEIEYGIAINVDSKESLLELLEVLKSA